MAKRIAVAGYGAVVRAPAERQRPQIPAVERQEIERVQHRVRGQ